MVPTDENILPKQHMLEDIPSEKMVPNRPDFHEGDRIKVHLNFYSGRLKVMTGAIDAQVAVYRPESGFIVLRFAPFFQPSIIALLHGDGWRWSDDVLHLDQFAMSESPSLRGNLDYHMLADGFLKGEYE